MTLKIPQRSKSITGLSYVTLGQGDPLVLIHGVGLKLEAWFRQLDVLAEQFTVYLVDMPGHGESELMPECTSISAYTDVIAKWIECDIQAPVVIAGHSMGSMIALNFGIRNTQSCRGIIAMNSVYQRSEAAKRAVYERVQEIKQDIDSLDVTAPVKRWFDFPLEGESKINAELCAQWLSQANLDGYSQAYEIFCMNDGPLDTDLENLALPTLFITGEGDPNSSPLMSSRMAQLCPSGQVYVVEQARHMAPMTHSDEINPLVIEFSKRCFNSA
ncbi:alpha/beta fold hydrolase [Marinomonas balearica]|uniref:Pimeloyl-ACP methyl ester carboxylesterase n=1 Tax=Marinomonas balearica TaxID=491947 RepID=A0A4R6M4A8_9GAMM|nr:alpha/beta hydrolase [Marinomonas balearica]TDO95330.1 pimeloyl-ACP methyl ester carboxylesterase [Marinomonas balearica]